MLFVIVCGISQQNYAAPIKKKNLHTCLVFQHNLPLHYCICAFVWGLSSLLSPCFYCVISVHSSELLRPHGCNYSGRYVGIMYVVPKKLLLLPAIFLQPCLFDGIAFFLMHVVCMCMTVVKYNLLTAASVSVSVSAPEAGSSILVHKRGCMLLVCVLHVATSVLDCLYSLLISSILVPDVPDRHVVSTPCATECRREQKQKLNQCCLAQRGTRLLSWPLSMRATWHSYWRLFYSVALFFCLPPVSSTC